MSAECNLAGLFPPQGSQVWNDEIPWQPVPVHTVTRESDYVSSLDHCSEICVGQTGFPDVC